MNISSSFATTGPSFLQRMLGAPDLRPYLIVIRRDGELLYGDAVPHDNPGRVSRFVAFTSGLLQQEVVAVERGPATWSREAVAAVNPTSRALRREARARQFGQPPPVLRSYP